MRLYARVYDEDGEPLATRDELAAIAQRPGTTEFVDVTVTPTGDGALVTWSDWPNPHRFNVSHLVALDVNGHPREPSHEAATGSASGFTAFGNAHGNVLMAQVTLAGAPTPPGITVQAMRADGSLLGAPLTVAHALVASDVLDTQAVQVVETPDGASVIYRSSPSSDDTTPGPRVTRILSIANPRRTVVRPMPSGA